MDSACTNAQTELTLRNQVYHKGLGAVFVSSTRVAGLKVLKLEKEVEDLKQIIAQMDDKPWEPWKHLETPRDWWQLCSALNYNVMSWGSQPLTGKRLRGLLVVCCTVLCCAVLCCAVLLCRAVVLCCVLGPLYQ